MWQAALGSTFLVPLGATPCAPRHILLGTGVFLGVGFHDFRVLYAKRTGILACFLPKMKDSCPRVLPVITPSTQFKEVDTKARANEGGNTIDSSALSMEGD